MSELPRFATKDAARRWVWDRLVAEGAARFPLPPHGRIPNFVGAETAARRLFEIPVFARARVLKINPDSPQRPVRQQALERGIVVYMPTPRLRSGFLVLDPRRIPPDRYREAARLSGSRRWARAVSLDEIEPVDAIVTGSVAVTRSGKRCGKGHGYGDIEYAILRELGHPPVPVATTVHPLQIVGDFPRDPNDLPLNWVVTPDHIYEVPQPLPPPEGLDWSALSDADLAAMPVLKELKRRKGSSSG